MLCVVFVNGKMSGVERTDDLVKIITMLAFWLEMGGSGPHLWTILSKDSSWHMIIKLELEIYTLS